jgi:hypothetical protein
MGGRRPAAAKTQSVRLCVEPWKTQPIRAQRRKVVTLAMTLRLRPLAARVRCEFHNPVTTVALSITNSHPSRHRPERRIVQVTRAVEWSSFVLLHPPCAIRLLPENERKVEFAWGQLHPRLPWACIRPLP